MSGCRSVARWFLAFVAVVMVAAGGAGVASAATITQNSVTLTVTPDTGTTGNFSIGVDCSAFAGYFPVISVADSVKGGSEVWSYGEYNSTGFAISVPASTLFPAGAGVYVLQGICALDGSSVGGSGFDGARVAALSFYYTGSRWCFGTTPCPTPTPTVTPTPTATPTPTVTPTPTPTPTVTPTPTPTPTPTVPPSLGSEVELGPRSAALVGGFGLLIVGLLSALLWRGR